MFNWIRYKSLIIGILLFSINSIIIGGAVNYTLEYSLEGISIIKKIDSLNIKEDAFLKDKDIYFKSSKNVSDSNKDSLILANNSLYKRGEDYLKERINLDKRIKSYQDLKWVNYVLSIFIPLLILYFYWLGFKFLNRFVEPRKKKNDEAIKE